MAYKIIDLHIHTDNSPDGNHPAMELCEQAVAKGVRAVAFTDHYDLTEDYQRLAYKKRAEHSYFETAKARDAFAGKLLVLKGVELGEALHDPEKAEPVYTRDYDIILGSVHNLKDQPDFKSITYTQDNVPKYLERYFEELISLSEWGGCDVIAHLTCPLRYITGRQGIQADLRPYRDRIDTILDNIIKTGKALEVNTSELFGKLGKTMPDGEILRRYRQLGGKYVTVGSDAHYAAHIARGIPQALQLLEECGFDKLTFYMKREPLQINIR